MSAGRFPRPTGRAALLAALALGALLATGVAAAARSAGPWQTTVASVRFRGDGAADENRLARLVDVVPGTPLTPASVRTSLRNLFATRLFADLSVEATTEESGTVVVFVLVSAPKIERFSVEGRNVPEKGGLRDAVGLEPGEVWSLERGDEARRRALRFLRDRGHFDAVVLVQVDAAPDETGVIVTFRVTPGAAVLAALPEWTGTGFPIPVENFRKKARLKTGRPYREPQAREDAERYTLVLREAGFARAEVRYDRERRSDDGKTATPVYSLFAGPRTVLKVAGAPAREVLKDPESPWLRGDPVDEDSLKRLQRSLLARLHREGYARASVNYDFQREGDEETATFRLAKGERWAVGRVSVEGSREVPAKKLVPLLATRPRGVLSIGRLDDRVLATDRESLASSLRARGFADAVAKEPEVTDGSSRFLLDVRFPVDEGPRYVVSSVEMEGASAVPEATLRAGLTLTAGAPWTAEGTEADAGFLRAAYADRGYFESRVEPRVTTTEREPGRRDVTVRHSVVEGAQSLFGKTIVRGNVRTRTSVLEDALTYREGDPLTMSKLMTTRSRLDRLGVFSRIEVTTLPVDAETRSRSVVVAVQESKPWNLLYGVGAEYDSTVSGRRLNPRFSLAVSYLNLFGKAVTATVEGRYSQRDSRALARLVNPSAFGWDAAGNLTFYVAQQKGPDYEVNRTGAFAQLEKKLSAALRATGRYQYEIIEPTGDPMIIGQLDRNSQQARISSLAAGVTVDTRDDAIDPRTGVFVVSEAKYAFPLLAADANFVKGLLQASLYRPWGRSRFALSLRLGATQSYAACDPLSNPSCLPNLTVPIVERFFAGGRSSNRAYPLDGLGIEGQTLFGGSPSGGNALIVLNAESRIRVVGDFGLSVFADAGNVWASPSVVRLSDIRVGVGLGVSYLTPVGPARLEYGLKIGRKAGEDPGAVSFSIGFPF